VVTGDAVAVGGIGIEELEVEALERHARGLACVVSDPEDMPVVGQYRWRRRGEVPVEPATIATMQAAGGTRAARAEKLDEFEVARHDRGDRARHRCGAPGSSSATTPIQLPRSSRSRDLKIFVTARCRSDRSERGARDARDRITLGRGRE